MISCFISLIIAAIVALIFLYLLEWIFGQFLPIPAPIINLIRLLVGLLLLLYFLECVMGNGGFVEFYPGHWR